MDRGYIERQFGDLKTELGRAVRRNTRSLKGYGKFDGRSSTGIIIPDPEPNPTHYHIVYSVPREDTVMPGWRHIYLTTHDAYDEVARMGLEGEPRTEWYEDGSVGIETAMHGRSGLFWVVLGVRGCLASRCHLRVQLEQRRARATGRYTDPRAIVASPGT